jgi:acyl-[acyl-carrier-protein]-phospholipid O-acyltransferase/long-chain-fatty-acid--[acyl-carrier-protein] ligase
MTHSTYRETLRRPGLPSFLWTQFLGALNDNVFKIAASMLAIQAVSQAEAARNLSLVGALFILPFLLGSGYAGQLADVYSKRTVLIVSKSLEIVAAGLGAIAFIVGRLELVYAVVFLLALQSTFFSPAKYGIVPEVLPDRDLSRANGLLEMSTFVAIVAGTAIGGFLFDVWRDQLWLIGVVVVGIAIVGTATSVGIPPAAPAAPGTRIHWNPWSEIALGLAHLWKDRVLWLTVVGISYFWFLGALLQLVMVLFGSQVMHLEERWVGVLLASAAVGIAAGSLVAGRVSGDKVELGLAPIGAIGMGVFSILLAGSGESFAWAATYLAMVGFFGGVFAVPLNALIQQRSGAKEKGRLLATTNFLNTIGILLASLALWAGSSWLALPPDRIIFVFGVLTLLSSVYVLAVVPEFLIRFSLWLLTHTVYRIRIRGQEHVPFRGPALLVCNHLSHVDGFLVGACVQRFIRFMVYRPYFEVTGVHWLLKRMHAIPVAGGNRREVVAAIEAARDQLRAGHVVCIFAEGSISRTGNLLPFKRGFERIVADLDVPVIPVCLDRVWGSIFSFKAGRFFWKLPERLPYPVTVTFGAPMPSTATATDVRQRVMEMGSAAAEETAAVHHRRAWRTLLDTRFARNARRHWWAPCVSDTLGRRLTRGRTLVGGVLLARWMTRHCPGESMVGVLLPSSVGGALVNLGATLSGRVPVNLNFTAGPDAMGQAVAQCDIRTVVTSRLFLKKIALDAQPGWVFVEDILKQMTTIDRLGALLLARCAPLGWLKRACGGRRMMPDDLATVIFSSGSTGVPKGVMLSHGNILSNIDALAQIFWSTADDCLVGVLPFFHSFGFTASIWFPLVIGFRVAYHPSPMDARAIGELVHAEKATLLISTPTFYGAYLRKCPAAQFASLRLAMVGAEKLRAPLAEAFTAKYGLDLLEGYGCTEMSPVVSVNIPDVTHGSFRQEGTRPGSVGHPIPGVVARVVDPETGEGPLVGTPGLLLVRGPNRMLGYLCQPERTAEVFRDGWYVTGDIAVIDEDGFIRITDRLARFSKIGGEMVPHGGVEEVLATLLGPDASCAVTAVPDEARGERLVAFYTDAALSASQLWESLCRTTLPKLWIPKREDLHFVESMPVLGTGKVDLRALRQLAVDRS